MNILKEKPLISIIIRTHNEETYLGDVLEVIKIQSYKNFEIIIVDDHSKDKTLDIAKKYKCKIISLSDRKFSHAYSCNRGAEEAKGEYLVYLNGHSIPDGKQYLERGLSSFDNHKVAGVYSLPISHKNGTFTDRLLHDMPLLFRGWKKYTANKKTPGLLATVGCMMRKDLWDRYHFKEINGGMGGEDLDRATHVIDSGYIIIYDPKFRVRHSHHLKLKDLRWQRKNRYEMSKSNGKPEKQRKYF